MPGPLNSIFAAIEPLITANLTNSGLVPTFGHSGADRYEEAAAPRVVWVPISEDYGPPRGLGGDEQVDAVGNMNLPGNAGQPLFTRTVDVECDIWGADRDTVETMIGAVVPAVHDAMYGSYGIQAARWLMPEETDRDGEVYRVTFQFLIPLVRLTPTETTATVTAEPMTYPTFNLGS